MMRRDLRCTAMVLVSLASGLAGFAGLAQAGPPEPASAGPVLSGEAFEPVQAIEFAEPGALANAWADYDADGQLDLAVSLKGGAIRLYRQDQGVFTSVGEELGLPLAGPEYRGLSWGDFDADGYPDLFAGASARDQVSAVFHNRAAGGFVDVAAEIGLTVPGRAARQSNWIDFDNDGDLDLYAADRAGENRLLHNEQGLFSLVAADQAPADSRPTVGACWVDYDQDGTLDLFLANQSGAEDALWRNDLPGFVDIAAQAGLDTSGRAPVEGGVGCAVGDYDNDGLFDVYFINYGRNRLFRNLGDGLLEDVTDQSGTAAPDHAVGGDWGDFNNDGHPDLFVTGYEGPPGAQVPVNYLYLNKGNGSFENILTRDHPLNAGDHGVIWIDYDLDGRLDLSLTDGYGPEGGYFVFRNDLPDGEGGPGLNVSVRSAAGVVLPGAEVRLYDPEGRLLGSRIVHTGGGYNAQSAAPVHFGLSRPGPVRVEVTVLTGAGRIIQGSDFLDPADFVGRAVEVSVP